MNAITFLTKEHDKIRHHLATISKKTTRYAIKKAKFKAICKELITHETMEQKAWYPYFKNSKKLKKEVRHLVSEEKHAASAMKKFRGVKLQEAWDMMFAKFKKAVENHAREEEKKLFPNVRQILDAEELDKIGNKMRQFKAKLKNKLKNKKLN